MTTRNLMGGPRLGRFALLIAGAVLALELAGTELWDRAFGVARPDAVGYAVLVVLAALVVVRNRYPVETLALTAAGATAYVWLGQAGPFWTVALVLAIWAAVSAGHRITTLVVGSIFAAAFVAAGLIVRAGHAVEPEAPMWLLGWLTAGFVLGEVSRGRREYIAAIEQRAIDAERSRDEEARRRAGEERLRIARDLHDVLAHSISVINVQAGVAVHLLDKRPDQARQALVTINETSSEAMRELRATLGVLRQADDVDPRAPTPGLERLDELVETARATGLAVDVSAVGDPLPLPPAPNLAVYRIVQESLTNVTRHAGAHHVSISILRRPEAVEVTVDDDGSGMPTGTAPRPGNGLTGMRERAAAIGGSLDAGPRPEGGFRVHAWLPTR
jgi:signal transduction histidine kinase